MLRLVETGAAGDGRSTDVMEITKLDDLRDIANLGLSLAEAKQVLAALQREAVAAQVRDHALPCAPAASLPLLRRRLPSEGLPPASDRNAVRPGDRTAAAVPLHRLWRDREGGLLAAAWAGRPLTPS